MFLYEQVKEFVVRNRTAGIRRVLDHFASFPSLDRSCVLKFFERLAMEKILITRIRDGKRMYMFSASYEQDAAATPMDTAVATGEEANKQDAEDEDTQSQVSCYHCS